MFAKKTLYVYNECMENIHIVLKFRLYIHVYMFLHLMYLHLYLII